MKNELRADIDKINLWLKNYMQHTPGMQEIIYEAMEYSLFAGGKRLRPVLMLETAKMCGGDENEIIPFACAMEMIHTYSLIHDDLPAMDNDELRRGMPTSHIKFGEAAAILAGDALLNKAFETVSAYSGNYPQRALRAIAMLAESSGTEGMIGGQVIDMESEGKDIGLDVLQHLHLLKTGAIIRSSCTIGALMSGADSAQIQAVDEFASNLGVAFQIRDDILDCISSDEVLGKSVGSDEKSGKNTYVKILGLERSEELVKEYTDKAIKALDMFGESARFLTELAMYLVGRSY